MFVWELYPLVFKWNISDLISSHYLIFYDLLSYKFCNYPYFHSTRITPVYSTFTFTFISITVMTQEVESVKL